MALGGTRRQHLADVVADRILHRHEEPGTKPTHWWVTMTGETRLSRIPGVRRKTWWTCFSHQAVARLGDGLILTARAPAGTFEAIDAVDRDFVLAVQWHAESAHTQASAPPTPRDSFVAFALVRAGAPAGDCLRAVAITPAPRVA